jgi:hypothetical protein
MNIGACEKRRPVGAAPRDILPIIEDSDPDHCAISRG